MSEKYLSQHGRSLEKTPLFYPLPHLTLVTTYSTGHWLPDSSPEQSQQVPIFQAFP